MAPEAASGALAFLMTEARRQRRMISGREQTTARFHQKIHLRRWPRMSIPIQSNYKPASNLAIEIQWDDHFMFYILLKICGFLVTGPPSAFFEINFIIFYLIQMIFEVILLYLFIKQSNSKS